MSDALHYAGSELELFRDARHWKRYIGEQLAPHVRGDVLEVGAGLGGTTPFVHRSSCSSWTCLEPDAALAAELRNTVVSLRDREGRAPFIEIATSSDLEPSPRFDCILYLDVLEHILDDRGELARAAALLRPQGRLVVLSPAHQWLYSPFDRAIGHHRRYTLRSLLESAPPSVRLHSCRYLDCAGILASLVNRLLLRQVAPSRSQIRFWDEWLVPVSQVLDAPLGFALGKSVLVAWSRDGAGAGAAAPPGPGA